MRTSQKIILAIPLLAVICVPVGCAVAVDTFNAGYDRVKFDHHDFETNWCTGIGSLPQAALQDNEVRNAVKSMKRGDFIVRFVSPWHITSPLHRYYGYYVARNHAMLFQIDTGTDYAPPFRVTYFKAGQVDPVTPP